MVDTKYLISYAAIKGKTSYELLQSYRIESIS